jgi:hypothetical protein
VCTDHERCSRGLASARAWRVGNDMACVGTLCVFWVLPMNVSPRRQSFCACNGYDGVGDECLVAESSNHHDSMAFFRRGSKFELRARRYCRAARPPLEAREILSRRWKMTCTVTTSMLFSPSSCFGSAMVAAENRCLCRRRRRRLA